MTVLIVKFGFYALPSNSQNLDYKDVNKGDSLIILKEFDLTKKIVHATHAPHAKAADVAAEAASTAHSALAAVADAYWKIRDQAKEEFEKTGKINGYEVLNLRTMEKLWISHYDMKVLTNTMYNKMENENVRSR